MNIRIRDEAEAELEDAFDYYQRKRDGLGHKFLDDYLHGVQQIAGAPHRWPYDRASKVARRYRLDHFPYNLIYRVLPDHCMIIAVAHQRRRPGYWRDRLRE